MASLWSNPIFENTENTSDTQQNSELFNVLHTALKQIKQISTPERFTLEYQLILSNLSLLDENNQNQSGYSLLSTLSELPSPSTPKYPQHQKLVAAGRDIRCDAKVRYTDENVFIEVDSLSAPELHLEINLNELTCTGSWFNLLSQRCNWDCSRLPFVATKPSTNELKVTIDENNYVLINLDIIFKPIFTVEYYDLKLQKLISTTNEKLEIQTNSLYQLVQEMMIEFGYFDEIFNIRVKNDESPARYSFSSVEEDDDVIIQQGDTISLMTTTCSVCKSAKEMPVQPHKIKEEYLCDICYHRTQKVTKEFKDSQKHLYVLKGLKGFKNDNNMMFLYKTNESDSDSLKFELYSEFTDLKPKKRKVENNLSPQLNFEISSEVEKTFLTSVEHLDSFVLELTHQGYSLFEVQPQPPQSWGDDIHKNYFGLFHFRSN